MKITLELNEILEAKLTRLLEHEGEGEHLNSRALGLLEEAIDVALEDYPDESWDISEEFASLGELL
jgi:hypothetical protein